VADEAAIDMLVLAALQRGGAASGRAISRLAGPGVAVHRALRRLERDRLVSSGPLPRARARQRLYRLTGDGEEALAVSRLAARSVSRRRAA
jgi:DNA-binding PadR family transcriptional regulator